MDWQRSLAGIELWLLLLCLPMPFTLIQAWSLPAHPVAPPAAAPVPAAIPVARAATTTPAGRQLNAFTPYLDLALCPIRPEPWSCARQRSARILDAWDDELQLQWQKLKVEADRQLNATIERRGYSASELPIKEKPSTLLKKIEIGTKYMKEYLAETMDGFLGREYEYLQAPKSKADDSENVEYDDDDDEEAETEGEAEADGEGDADADADADADGDADGDAEAEEESAVDNSIEDEAEVDAASNSVDHDDEEEDEEEEDEADEEPEAENESAQIVPQPTNDVKSSVFSDGGASGGVEFIELEDGADNAAGSAKKPGKGGKRKKNKNKRRKKKKKGGQSEHQPATLVVVQAAPEHHEVDAGHESGPAVVSHGGGHGGGGGGRPFKRKTKRGKRKRKGQHSTAVVEHESSDTLGLELLDDLLDVDADALLAGGKRKHKNPFNYGRSNGVTRGKKKKKKKAAAKLLLIGSLLKAKIELLLKILGAHLQIKFFAIALIGLLINIARFWIDVKRGGAPSKVVYVEHAHHQHHYEDHGEDWGEQGSYWKRSLQTEPSIEDLDSSTDSYQNRPLLQQSQPEDAHHLAYRNQYQWQ
ncbi:uncharacterized protein Dmoj_GI12559 [Drosophila mojavensis]|uniref:Uncharacterized protein n=1 Tax=Drosophila mojavensis TaxID=7230 RepID=B4KXD4_DROMO|nr:uncharacterized protein Dmoj_GI12559 [Drosophila mojavensis]